MSQDEDPKRQSRLSSLTGAFRRRHEDRLEVTEYMVGDVRAEKPVIVGAKGMLIGDLLAPEVVVSGIVYGYVACRHLTVAPGGQIWGDVYVSSVELAPDGRINGWMSTLDAGTVDLLRARELGLGDLPDVEHLPDELLQRVLHSGADIEADQKESQRRSGIWRQLRAEAALALIARKEIEATFDQRLDEALTESIGPGTGSEDDSMGSQAASLEELQLQDDETDQGDRQTQAKPPARDASDLAAEVLRLQAYLRRTTALAQKYYGELLWTRAELRAARREEGME